MKNNQSLLKLFFCILILVISSVIGVLPLAAADGQSVGLPLRTKGDEWKFVVDYKGDVGMLCNLTTTVTETSVFNPSGNYKCFELTSLGTGIVYGENVSGAWSMAIKEYYGTSDFSLAEIRQNRTVTIIDPTGSNTTTQTTNTVYNPPFEINSGFPLSVSKSWSTNSTITSVTTLDAGGHISQENSTFTLSMNFVVVRTEKIATKAGEFETYVLRGTGADGSVQEIYYSPNVGMQVKEIDYDSKGNVAATMVLEAYSVAGSADTISFYWIALAIVGVVVAVGALSTIALKRRSSKAASK